MTVVAPIGVTLCYDDSALERDAGEALLREEARGGFEDPAAAVHRCALSTNW